LRERARRAYAFHTPVRRTFAVVAALAAAILAPPAHALFHAAQIAELNAQGGGSAAVQYVEIEMLLPSQTSITNSILGAFECDGDYLGDLLLVPSNVPNGGTGVRWIMATTTPVGGIVPNFSTVTASIPTACGQVCWGAPGVSVPNPASWNHQVPGNYVDCLAYGPYTGPTHPASGTPTPLPPGDGTFALTRLTTTGSNVDDFALRCPSPQNNAGNVGNFGACSNPTTTTSSSSSTSTSSTTSSSTSSSSTTSTSVPTTTSSTLAGTSTSTSVTSSTVASTSTTVSTSTSTPTSTSSSTTTVVTSSSTTVTATSTSTSTTVPGATADLLPGKKLELRVKEGKPEKSALQVISTKDAGLTLGRGPGTADDPTLAGGRLVVASSSAAGAFTTTYPLDTTQGSWSPRRKKGAVVGYTFKSGGAIRGVKITAGKTVVVKGKGAGLGHDLDDDPAPVTVVLQIGQHAYCLEFGGQPTFKAGKRFGAKKAPAPAACAPIP